MFDFGFSEVLVILGIALVVLGPEKLPKVATQIGRWTGRARAMARQLRTQLEQEIDLEETLRASRSKATSTGAAQPTSPGDLGMSPPGVQASSAHQAPATPPNDLASPPLQSLADNNPRTPAHTLTPDVAASVQPHTTTLSSDAAAHPEPDATAAPVTEFETLQPKS